MPLIDKEKISKYVNNLNNYKGSYEGFIYEIEIFTEDMYKKDIPVDIHNHLEHLLAYTNFFGSLLQSIIDNDKRPA